MKRQVWLTALIGTLALACGDDVAPADTDGGSSTSTGDEPTTMTMTSPATTMTTTGVDSSTTDDTLDPDSSGTLIDPTDPSSSSTTDDDTDSDDTNTGEPATFVVTIENLSGDTPLAGPFSPGAWAEHDIATMPIFDQNTVASAALALLAEDGDPTDLLTDIEAGDSISSGVFNTPVDADDPAPIGPGESYSFEFLAQPGSRLSFASMLIESNDVFLGTGPLGIALFQANGNPIDRDITNSLALWDAGSEAQQPPGGGGYQPLGDPGTDGPDESGVISVRNESTRAIPAARRLMEVDVALEAGTTNYTITFENISEDTGGLLTTLSGMAWATHDDTVSLVTPGGAAGDLAGLEALAEDGDPVALEATLAALDAVEFSDVTGGMAPGETVSFTVTPTAAAPLLSFATMVVASNDAFIAPGAEGIRLVEDDGSARSAGAIEDDILDLVAVWDAGTEANQTPGAGADQPAAQLLANTGEADEDATVRFYRDGSNDLGDLGPNLAIQLTSVVAVPGAFTVTITNTAASAAFQTIFTRFVWGMTDGTIPFFTAGTAASPGLEELAEDGEPAGFDQELADAGVTNHGIAAMDLAPTDPPTFLSFPITTTSDEPILNLAAMIVPSNDTFVALGEVGVSLYDDAGVQLSDADINTAIADALAAYDAGTEQNQAGAAGRDMAGPGLQAAGNTGAPEGPGTIRNVTPGVSGVLTNEPVWSYPAPQQLVRVTVAPAK